MNILFECKVKHHTKVDASRVTGLAMKRDISSAIASKSCLIEINYLNHVKKVMVQNSGESENIPDSRNCRSL